ncbi:hypothetical protein [Nocardiopsis composta]|uniref:Zinc-finger domain-containing protein n=1 Tax=Nocardiopsis composta TaxID=157465 RepID=A0A7W8VH12_9ACTN|nr:hypothetical protein [Nocardiopsis composta]MBB5435700.1 hypothetical protein [Nocardiopsis composta]
MTHLDEEQIRLAGGRGPGGLDGAARGHLDGCPECAARVAGTARLGAVLRAAEPEAGPPSFDALIAPALAAERSAPAAPAPAPSARASLRLVAGLVLRQARLVPRMLWPLSAVGFAVLLAAALKAPSPGLGALFLGPGATLVVTVGALAACEPRRDPRMELMRTMRVPPVAVWLSRLALVLGADLAAAGAVSLAAGLVHGGPREAAVLVASWLGPALLGSALAAFGSVWRSPLVGAVLGTSSWLLSTLAAGPVPAGRGMLLGPLADTIGPVWSTGPVSLLLAAALLAWAARLVAREGRALPEG